MIWDETQTVVPSQYCFWWSMDVASIYSPPLGWLIPAVDDPLFYFIFLRCWNADDGGSLGTCQTLTRIDSVWGR